MHCVDLRRASSAELRTLSSAEEIEFVNLSPGHVPALVELGFDRLRALSLRHLRTDDLSLLQAFPRLEILEVWQSEQVRSLAGLEVLQELHWLALFELGPLPSLAPIADLACSLEELILTGGIWKDQKLSGDFEPIAALKNLRKLTLTNVRGPGDLTPLLNLPQLRELTLATALFPVDAVARVAASYPFWREQRPWLQSFGTRDQDPEGCSRCGSGRLILLLQRQKRIWCETCDADRLEKVLARFDRIIKSYART